MAPRGRVVAHQEVAIAPAGVVELHLSFGPPASGAGAMISIDERLTPRASPNPTPGEWTRASRFVRMLIARITLDRAGRLVDAHLEIAGTSSDPPLENILRAAADECLQ